MQQEYLKYIRSLGIEAWIPDTPGNGSKMSVPDQCRSGVLCLEYEGTDIYIRGNTRRTINYVGWRNNYSAILGQPNRNIRSKFVTAADYEKNKNNARHKFATPVLNDTRTRDAIGGHSCHLEIRTLLEAGSNSMHSVVRKNVNDIECKIYNQMSKIPEYNERSNRIDSSMENKYFSPAMAGVQFKRVVCEKLTREVRVARQYVSSLPYNRVAENPMGFNDERTTTSSCQKGPVKAEKCERGFVRRLVKQFDANDDGQ